MSDRNQIRRQIRDSRRQEEQGMERLGGQRHRGSGNGSRKGDGRTSDELVEFKRTGKTQITIKATDLEKIAAEAAVTGRTPALSFELKGKHYVVHEEADWLEYRSRGR